MEYASLYNQYMVTSVSNCNGLVNKNSKIDPMQGKSIENIKPLVLEK